MTAHATSQKGTQLFGYTHPKSYANYIQSPQTNYTPYTCCVPSKILKLKTCASNEIDSVKVSSYKGLLSGMLTLKVLSEVIKGSKFA